MNNADKLFGRNKALKVFRKFHRMTQQELGTQLNFSKSFVSDIETGKKNVSIKLVDRYAEAFSVPSWEILYLAELYDSKCHNSKITGKLLNIIEWITADEATESVKLDLKRESFRDKEFGFIEHDRRMGKYGRRSSDLTV